ncbi:MAG: fimbrillin family protein [Proteiniphilum sp.]|nr:fimbrillin family protein [Proteiniphilum sp.]
MKKNNLFLVLLTALLVMSCSKDETMMSIPQESNAITFGTYVGRDAKTRATALDLDGLKATGIGFGVFAFYSNETANEYNNTTPPSNFTPNFMYNQQVTWNTSKWGYTPVKYWPNEGNDKLTFFAYAPYSTGSTNNISAFNVASATPKTAIGDPTLLFTVHSAAKSQTDLLYADATGLKNVAKQTTTGTVNFLFLHALSRIGFNVEVMADKVNDDATGTADDGSIISDAIAAGTVVSVQKVELIGQFTSRNILNVAAGTWANPVTLSTATDFAYALDYNATQASSNFVNTVANGVAIAPPQKLNADDSYLMIIPKEFKDADLLKIKVTYTVTTADGALANASGSVITNEIESIPFAINFEAGRAYTFNLHLGLTSVKFDASITPWDVTTPGTVVNVPLN